MFLSGQTAKTAVALRKRGEPQFAPIKTTGVNIPKWDAWGDVRGLLGWPGCRAGTALT